MHFSKLEEEIKRQEGQKGVFGGPNVIAWKLEWDVGISRAAVKSAGRVGYSGHFWEDFLVPSKKKREETEDLPIQELELTFFFLSSAIRVIQVLGQKQLSHRTRTLFSTLL